MNFEKLLGTHSCACGKTHSCAIEQIIIGKGANKKLAALLDGYHHVLLVADTHTYACCAEEIRAQLTGRMQGKLIFEREGLLIPDERACAEVFERLTPQSDLIVGIGSGVIQDICKYVSFERGLPYIIVATAPSMDGYASVGAAMIMGGMKVTYSAHVPKAIIADIDVLKDAPMEMIQSGYGDILGKYSCLNDWKLAHVIRGEDFCPYVYDLTMEMLIKVKDLGERLLARDADAIERLMEAIVGVGVAMAMVGNSRPASGSEHHLSHFFEIVGILRDEPYLMHGTDVAYSSIYTQRLREKLLALPVPKKKTPLSRKAWEEEIRAIYGKIADSVIALQDKMGWYAQDDSAVYAQRWQEICEVLKSAPGEEEMLGYLASIGLDIAQFNGMYGREKINTALRYAKDLKDRYSVLWLAYDLLD